MKSQYKALQSISDGGPKAAQITTRMVNIERRDLVENEVRIKIHYSSLNYKDALAVTGKGQIFKSLPLVGGIDLAGLVIESNSAQFNIGEHVIVTGCNLGETHDGGYAEEAIEHESNIVKLPNGLTLREAMIYGTAGFTAGLVLKRFEQNNQKPSMGPIVVTGASGGVGQFAVSFLAKENFEVWAVSSKRELVSRLKEIGAEKVLRPEELELATRPLEKTTFGGVVDNVGGATLAGLLPKVNLWGNVACVGLAQSAELNTTVMPMILRGVSLLGISSNNTARPWRLEIWQDLATHLKPDRLSDFVSGEIGLESVLTKAHEMLERKTSGRALVKI